MKLSEKNWQQVYIYGTSGIGKSSFIFHYCKRKEYIYFDAAHICEEDMEVPKRTLKNDKLVVIIDNLQFAEEGVKNQIRLLTARGDIWLVLLSRSTFPAWLSEARYKGKDFTFIEPLDLLLSQEEMEKYFKAKSMFLDRETLEAVHEQTRGHGVAVRITAEVMESSWEKMGRNAYNEDTIMQVKNLFWDYLEECVYSQWDVELREFVLRLSVVDSFNWHMAECITRHTNVDRMIKLAFDTGSFMKYEQGEFVFDIELRRSMRRILKRTYSEEELGSLYYDAGSCYEQEGKILDALFMYQLGKNNVSIRQLLIANARKNPAIGFVYELRKYYYEIPRREVEQSAELIASMSMLESLSLRIEESEYWYDILWKRHEKLSGKPRQEARSWIAYLDIALPHRGSKSILQTILDIGILLKNREIRLPDFSITSNMPSQMNGGKDFCEWSKKDEEIARGFGKTISFVTGNYGKALVSLALAESFFEKGKDSYEVLKLASKGEMQANQSEVIEQLFVAVAIQTRLDCLTGHLEDSYGRMFNFKDRVILAGNRKLLLNVESFLCRFALYRGDKVEIEQWYNEAPDETLEFNIFERYRYLTKVRVYLMYGKYQMAYSLLQKLLYYSEVMERVFVRIESKILMAIVLYRMNQEEWKDYLQEALMRAKEYHFVRIFSREGAALYPLLLELDLTNSGFEGLVMTETKQVADYYPHYLKEHGVEELVLSEKALAILRYQEDGKTNEEIAEILDMTLSNVKYHSGQTSKKLGVRGKTAAVAEARRRKLI